MPRSQHKHARKDPYQHTVNHGNHTRRREEDLLPGRVDPNLEHWPSPLISRKDEEGPQLGSILQVEVLDARDSART